jgi:hypothetical protein
MTDGENRGSYALADIDHSSVNHVSTLGRMRKVELGRFRGSWDRKMVGPEGLEPPTKPL